MRLTILILVNILTLLLAACAPSAELPQDDIPSTTDPIQGNETIMPTTTVPDDAGLQPLIEKAIADLAERLSIPRAEIVVLEATPVVWNDSSLGCPQPGMAYIQVPEDGLLIRLQAGRQIYPYHSGGFRDPFLCEIVMKDPVKPPKIDFFNLTPGGSHTPPTPDNSIPPGGDT